MSTKALAAVFLAASLTGLLGMSACAPPQDPSSTPIAQSARSDGRTGTLTIFVAPSQLDAVTQAAAAAKPTGAVPLVIKVSSGLATPL